MFTTLLASHRTAVGVLVAVVLAAATLLTLGLTGGASYAFDRVAGRAAAILEEIPGPDTGPVCPLDERYVDEEPKGLPRDVLAAWNRLVDDAGAQGVELCLHDGKRSEAQQQAEFDDAVEKFGTEELAAKYVLPPDKSMHVKGIAVDVQPLASAAWVEENGAALGWCRRYDNEPWHFEYDRRYVSGGCPAMEPSASGS